MKAQITRSKPIAQNRLASMEDPVCVTKLQDLALCQEIAEYVLDILSRDPQISKKIGTSVNFSNFTKGI